MYADIKMKIEEQVCSSELAKRLTDLLPVNTSSYFIWKLESPPKYGLLPTTEIKNRSDWNLRALFGRFPAFTVAELGET